MASFDYSNQRFESIPCNLCGRDDFFVLARKSKNGLDAKTCLCKNCGLIYLNPRMTKNGYNEYYRHFYRKDRSVIKQDEEFGVDQNFRESRRFGQALARRFRRFIHSGRVVDVGSSTGGVLVGMRDIMPDIEPLGIEPSLVESEYARARGVPTETCLFEDLDPQKVERASTVICVQSLNHLLDPRAFFQWSHDRLHNGGHIILSVKDFRFQCRRSGRVENGVQIDHPYMFTPEVLKLFLESVGFRVVYLDVDERKSSEAVARQYRDGLNRHHIRIVGVKEARVLSVDPEKISLPSAYQALHRQLRQPFLRMHYIFYYSKRLRFIRGVLAKIKGR